MSDKIVTIGAVSSILSGLVWLTLTPFMATIGICRGSCSSWADQPLVIRTLGRAVADQGWLSFAAPDTLYFSYGRFFFLVYVFIILGLIALRRAQIQRVGQQRQLARGAYLVLLVSLAVAMLGDFTSYGIGVFRTLLTCVLTGSATILSAGYERHRGGASGAGRFYVARYRALIQEKFSPTKTRQAVTAKAWDTSTALAARMNLLLSLASPRMTP